MGHIPIVDFELFGLNTDDPEAVDDVTLQDLVAEVKSALTTSGFMYLRNHGIDQSTIDNAFKSGRRFFELPESVKQRCKYDPDLNHGWIALHAEIVDPGANVDMHESLCLGKLEEQDLKDWPSAEVPSLTRDMEAFFHKCRFLTLRILSIISLALGKERDFFGKFHRRIGQRGNRTDLSTIYYHPISDDEHLKEGQLRLGEHTDYGSMTLLFQDNIGGLEVWDKTEQKFLPAVPVPGTVIVNIGDALQRWTADRLVSSRHRVALPYSRDARQRLRQSAAFFAMADEDAMLTCVDGSDKYPPISMAEHLDYKFKETIY